MDEKSEEYFKREAIIFFRSLIGFKLSANKSTRPTNFAGHIGRHMKPDLKKWFLEKYPNNSDYVKFFLENEDVFSYDCLSGDIRLNSYTSRFEKPNYLSDIESRATNPSTPLDAVSKRISELEFFLMIYRLFVDSYESNKTIYISVEQLVALFSDQKYDIIVNRISSLIAKDIGFNQKIIEYLSQNYETIFMFDERNKKISLRKSVIDIMNKYSKEIDDTVYDMFKALIAKYLRCKGGKDVNQLKAEIANRHNFIVYYLFERKEVCDEYTLLDFVESYPQQFLYKREVDSQGIVKRIINVKNAQKSQQNASFTIDQSQTQVNSNEINIHENSEDDDEIYYDEEDEEPIVNGEEGVADEEEEIFNEEENVFNEEEGVVNGVVAKEDVDFEGLIQCCVCYKDVSNEYISYSEYREWALKHKRCLLQKLIHSLKKECDKKFSVKTNVSEKEVQTYSTGNVRPRQGISSNSYFHY